ncbi:MAG: hypothetical protein E3J94_01285 [Desulfobacteraceae bacterium]|nr:MAG: hypothetical protein E3J94_01285 [Desulfobacteraceae bacterium]
MNYRLATILAREAVSTDFTKVIDLNLADPVSQLQITYESTGTGGGIPDGHVAKCITKIELVDGSDVLYSLSGQEAQAVDFYHRGIEPPNLNYYLAGTEGFWVFNVNFGRYLYDQVFAFDPKKFTNPQLKITIDRNAGGIVSSAGFLTVLAHIFDGKAITPEGFLMQKEINNYGMASASHEYIDLPTDYPVRKLFIAAQTYGVGPEWLLDTIKLSEDNDRKIPLSDTFANILRSIVGQNRPFREVLLAASYSTTNTFYCTPCFWPTLIATKWSNEANLYGLALYEGDGGRGYQRCTTAAGNYAVQVEGWCPHGAIEIPFGLQDDPADWYDVTKLGSLRLDILSKSGRSSADTVQIFLQQLRKYAA